MSVEHIINTEVDNAIRQHQGLGLWFLDEHDYAPPAYQPNGLLLITNRYDVYQRFVQAGWNIQFSDWDTSGLTQQSFDVVYYRISKEKAIVHWIIKASQQLLKSSGRLLLFGAKGEGLKGYYDRVRKNAEIANCYKLGKSAMSASLSGLGADLQSTIDDSDYSVIRRITHLGGQDVLSKPGVFGWQKVDAGSEFLADNWDEAIALLSASEKPKRVLDLGCGYGYISLRYWQSLDNHQRAVTTITATDSNAAAIACCHQNFKQWAVQGDVVAADCADGIVDKFDLVLCNPPFHQGFGVEGELTDRFLAMTERLLNQNGQALFVVNGFVPLARKAASRFKTVVTYKDNSSFKIFLVSY